jgi:hypothetical protein
MTAVTRIDTGCWRPVVATTSGARPSFLLSLSSSVLLLLLVATGLSACGVMEPPGPPLVVQAFVETGQPLPTVSVARAGGLDAPVPVPVADAEVVLQVAGLEVIYLPAPGAPGQYVPALAFVPRARDAFTLDVRVGGELARAQSVAPPVIALDSVRVRPAASPVRAVFADTLGASLREGFLYVVDVTLFWSAPPAGEEDWWVRARLLPPGAFPSAVVDFLLLTDEVRPESELATEAGHRRWRGLYAVPVDGPEEPLPGHTLEVALLRSGLDYARFAQGRIDVNPREPAGNVEGGVGIVAGISVARQAVVVGG